MGDHPLDRPIWAALASRQQPLSVGDGQARRFDPAYNVFAAAADRSRAAASALAELVRAHGLTAIVERVAPEVPEGLEAASRGVLWQMVGETLEIRPPEFEWVELGEADALQMQALAELTRPGPFASRTHQLGRFVGVKRDGRLVAMAGERMKPEGFTEVSAVCVHPDHRGHGYAAGLMSVIAQGIVSRGETPFLHVFDDNAYAIRVYEALGYRLRREMKMLAVRAP